MDKDKTLQEDRSICRAMIQTATAEGWDFECVAVPTENGQMRRSWENDEYFIQMLGVKRENVDTSRLDSGLPLFDNHPWENSAENTLGITVGYDFSPEGLIVRCKFGARAEEELKLDVKNGIIKTVSIEGTISNYSVTRELNKVPVYFADLWTPESLSFAPVPNDIGAQIEVKRAIQKQIQNTTPKADKSIIKSLTSKF
jgi:hypothetical protein